MTTRRNVLGALSFGPLLAVPALMLGGMGLAAAGIAADTGVIALSEAALGGIVAAAVAALMIGEVALVGGIIGLAIYYCWDALTRTDWTHEVRLLWAIFILAGNLMAFPIYWWVNVRGEGLTETTA